MLASLKIPLKDESKYLSCCFKILQWGILSGLDNGETSMVFFFFSCSLGHVGFEFPDQGWKRGVLTAGLPGKSQEWPC